MLVRRRPTFLQIPYSRRNTPLAISVRIDGMQIHLEPGQAVIPHGPDRELSVAEARPRNEP